MEHENVVSTGIGKVGISGIETETNINAKENKMEGLDPGLVALLKDNGMDSSTAQWNNPLFWIIILGFLRGKGGLFGGEGEGAGVAAGATQAKLDCLAQGQQDAAAGAHNMNMTNLLHSAEMAANNNTNRLAAQLAECCCNLRTGQANIVNEILKCCCDLKATLCDQTNTLTVASTLNTQRILDSIERHADEEQAAKLADCKTELSNCQQTNALNVQTAMLTAQIAELKACACSDDDHGHGRGAK